MSIMIVSTTESTDKDIKYLNINVAKEETERKPDIVRLVDGENCLEFERTDVKQGVVLPEKHGRLIDADSLMDDYQKYCEVNCKYPEQQRDLMCSACYIGDMMEMCEDEPTILPATEDEE